MQEITETDSIGLLQTRTTRGQTKQKKKAKGANAAKFIFNASITDQPAYLNYFNPDSEVEREMLGLTGPARVRSVLFLSGGMANIH